MFMNLISNYVILEVFKFSIIFIYFINYYNLALKIRLVNIIVYFNPFAPTDRVLDNGEKYLK